MDTIESLTKRETEVLKLLADGLNNKEIASKLFIATSMVKWYINELNSKLGTGNRDEIVTEAEKLGLLQQDEPNHNLPAAVTPFIGRRIELEAVSQLLSKADVRLLTILALGGMGKTRLALECAKAQFHNFKDIYLLPMQHMQDAKLIFPTLAEQMGYQFQDGLRNPKQQVLDYVSEKSMLLILDSAEYMLEDTFLIGELLQAASNIKVLVTSREKLNLHGEIVYALSGMQMPSEVSPDELLAYDAVQLFVDEAKRLHPDFEMAAENLEHIVQICHLVDGMPLAILLAASWTDVLSLERIYAEIQKNIDFLETTMRDSPARHRSIRAVCESTWERLSHDEQQIFAKMSVFRGGCTSAAVEAVTKANPRSLQSLFNKALLTRSANGRYEIHDLLRQFGEEQLDIMQEREATYAAHSAYFMEYLSELEADIKGRRQIEAIKDIDADFENIRHGWDWLLECKDYQSIGRVLDCLLWYFIFRSRLYDGYDFFLRTEEALSSIQNDDAILVVAIVRVCRIRVFVLASAKKELNENYDALLAEINSSLEIARRSQDSRAILTCLIIQSNFIFRVKLANHLPNSSVQLAKVQIESALEYSKILGDEFSMSYILLNYCTVVDVLGFREKGIQLSIESEKLCRKIGNKLGLSWVLFWRQGWHALGEGKFEEAEQHFKEIYDIHRELAYKSVFLSVSLSHLGIVECFRGNIEQAGHYGADAISIALDINSTESKTWAFTLLGFLALAEEDYVQSRQYFNLALENLWIANLLMHIGLALVHYALEDFREGEKWLVDMVLWTCRHSPLSDFNIACFCIATQSLRLAHDADNEKAVEYLGLAFSHPSSPKGFLQQCPFFIMLLDELKQKLGEDSYHAAWERGKDLDVEAVILEIKEDYFKEE